MVAVGALGSMVEFAVAFEFEFAFEFAVAFAFAVEGTHSW